MKISKVCKRIIRDSIGLRFLINPLANKLQFHGGILRSWVRQDCPFVYPLFEGVSIGYYRMQRHIYGIQGLPYIGP